MLLTVDTDKFNDMLDLDLEFVVKDNYGLDYLSWSRALLLLKQNFPTFVVQFVTRQHPENETTLPVHDIDEFGETRGSMIGCYLEDSATGAKSQVLWYPVMGLSGKGKGVKPAQFESDARCINDNMQRAAVRTISIVTGIGFNLYMQMDEEDLQDVLSPSSEETKRRAKSIKQDEEEEEEPKRKRSLGGTKRREEEPEEPEDEDDEDEDDDEEEEQKSTKRRSAGGLRRLPTRGGR